MILLSIQGLAGMLFPAFNNPIVSSARSVNLAKDEKLIEKTIFTCYITAHL